MFENEDKIKLFVLVFLNTKSNDNKNNINNNNINYVIITKICF